MEIYGEINRRVEFAVSAYTYMTGVNNNGVSVRACAHERLIMTIYASKLCPLRPVYMRDGTRQDRQVYKIVDIFHPGFIRECFQVGQLQKLH